MGKRDHYHRATWDDFVIFHEVLYPKVDAYSRENYIRSLFWEAVRAYLLSKRDVEEQQSGHRQYSYNIRPRFGRKAEQFFATLNGVFTYLILHCDEELAHKAASTYPAVNIYPDRNGMHITLDGSIPPEELITWIDAAYSRRKDEIRKREREFQAMVDDNPVDEEKLRWLIAFCGLEHRTDDILSLVRPSFWIEPVASTDIARGQSKFGGLPDMPPDMEYPTFRDKPLAFAAQINLAEVPVDAAITDLPQHGILYFFTIWGWHHFEDVNDWWDNPATWRVLYYDGAILPDEEAILPEMIDDEIFRSFAMVFYPRMMLPDPADLLKESKWAHYERELYVELYDRFLYMQKWFFDDPQNVVPCHWFRGYCQSLQNPMTPSGKNLLLQLDSDDKVFYWVNGSGRLYYFISDEDLRRRDFSNVHFEIES